jgi:hypothetical protein
MSNTIFTGSMMSAYVNSLLAKTGRSADEEGTQALAGTSADNKTLETALATPFRTSRLESAQRKLDAEQASLATDLRKAMSAAGLSLAGSVEFSLDDKGQVMVKASKEEDEDKLGAFFEADKSDPSFESRIASLTAEAQAQSGTSQQTTAIAVAARYAGSTGGLMALYQSLMAQQDATPAVFTFSASSSSLSYPGVLSSAA